MGEISRGTIKPVAKCLGRATVVFVVLENSRAMGEGVGRFRTCRLFVPLNGRFATRIGIAPGEARAHGEQLQTERTLRLYLALRDVVEVNPLGGVAATKGDEILRGRSAVERGSDGAVHGTVLGLRPKTVRRERAT